MKTLALALVLAAFAVSPSLKANEAAPTANAAAPETSAPAHEQKADHKAAHKAAKEECLAADKGLKGKKLHECIKSKMPK